MGRMPDGAWMRMSSILQFVISRRLTPSFANTCMCFEKKPQAFSLKSFRFCLKHNSSVLTWNNYTKIKITSVTGKFICQQYDGNKAHPLGFLHKLGRNFTIWWWGWPQCSSMILQSFFRIVQGFGGRHGQGLCVLCMAKKEHNRWKKSAEIEKA